MQAASGECPHCLSRVEISTVTFGFSRTRIVFVCPNCAIVIDDEWHSVRDGHTDAGGTLVTAALALVTETLSMMEVLNARVRYVVTFVFAAVALAAFLRHTAHTYAGFSREEIRTGALVTCSVVYLALMLWRKKPSR